MGFRELGFFSPEVMHMDRLAIQNDTTSGRAACERQFDKIDRDRPVMSAKQKRFARSQQDRGVI